jgi:DNA phosphorothioation-associated putative methyltransferase
MQPTSDTSAMQVLRHRTALLRRRFSAPVQLLLDDGLLTPQTSFFDYGCGYGEDVKFLKKMQFDAAGWDPHFAPEKPKKGAQVVNLGYILNVIENPAERAQTLKAAFDLAENLLVVAVMIRAAGPLAATEVAFGDGILTSWNTFQKYFSPREFREYLETTLRVEARLVSPGIAYVFKNAGLQQQFLQNRFASSKAGIAESLRQQIIQETISRWVSLYHELGRAPDKTEFAELATIKRIFGSAEAAAEALRAELNPETVKQAAERHKSALLITLSRELIRTDTRLKPADLKDDIAQQIRLYYGKWDNAKAAALQRLKELGDLAQVSRYINESSVGKVLPDDIYIHRDSLEYAPEMLQLLVELAKTILPADVEWNIAKIARNSYHVTFMEYANFYEEAHPRLLGAMKVLLHKNKLDYRDYRTRENPPILHRKELFIHSSHPLFETFSQLSRAEEEAGLLGRKDIGTVEGWQKLLVAKGYRVEGHQLATLC